MKPTPTQKRNNMVKMYMLSTICLTLLSTTYAASGDDDITGSYFDRNRLTQTQQERETANGCRTETMGAFVPSQKDMVACRGSWTGHVKTAEMCAVGWHVCSSSDSEMMSKVTERALNAVRGCYAMNAANKPHVGCVSDCQEDGMMMAGAGKNCWGYGYTDHKTCIPLARIDIPKFKENAPTCGYSPFISGVVCCRDTPLESSPKLYNVGLHEKLVKEGEDVTLRCRGEGSMTAPELVWSKNGVELPQNAAAISTEVTGPLTISSLDIKNASVKSEGFYSCMARSDKAVGVATGVRYRIIVTQKTSEIGCNAGVPYTILPGGYVFACQGKWSGHVKNAAKTLCARGYTVCHPKSNGIDVFNRIDLDDNRYFPGCYAMNGASHDGSECDVCKTRNNGNRMQGVGQDCASKSAGQYSCFGPARVDVWPNSDLDLSKSADSYSQGIANASEKEQKSCDFNAELTTGVLCCKKSGRRH